MSSASSDTSTVYRAIANTECSGVFWQSIREMQPYHNAPNYMSCRGDYHLFLRCGDKVYIEVRNAGEIVISFAELQKNEYLKYYYYLSLILANDEHKVMKNEPFNKLYEDIYENTGDRVWSLETAYIDETDYRAKTYKIIPSGNVCYYKVNPFDLEKMEYSTQKELDHFKWNYMNSLRRVKYLLHMEENFKKIAIEYQVNKMEKELEELSAFFEDKKNVVNLAAIQEKIDNNIDVLMIIYKNLVGDDKADNPEMVAKIKGAMEAKTALKLVSQILAT
jgi:hypothetical protein